MFFFVDHEVGQSKIRVNAVVIVIYYQRYLYYDVFVKMPPKCPTNRSWSFSNELGVTGNNRGGVSQGICQKHTDLFRDGLI